MNRSQQTILAVDDDLSVLKLLKRTLGDHYNLITATSAPEALSILESADPVDVILLDIQMPDMDGFTAVPLIREIEAHRATPIIMLTGERGHSSHHKGLLLGASDYILKPVSPDILRLRIKVHAENSRLRKTLEEMAFTDPLTNILNRRGLNDQLDREISRCRRSSLPMSLAMVDIDHFKRVNDQYGHATGDSVLQSVAELMSDHFKRATDLVGRLGGEEFVIVSSEIPGERFMERIQTCRDEIKAKVFETDSPSELRVSVSAGAVTLIPDQPPHFLMSKLLGIADTNLYKAKETRDTQVWSGES